MLLKRPIAAGVALAAASAFLVNTVVAEGPASAAPTIAGTYNSVRAQRVLDTRHGVGAARSVVKAGATLTFDATPAGLGSQPVSAVALTVTALRPTRSGHLTVYSAGSTRPNLATISFTAGQDTANAVVVKVGRGGLVSVYNRSVGTVALIADLAGYWTGGTVNAATGGALTAVTPARILDTRSAGNHAIAARSGTAVPVLGHRGVPSSGVSAVLVNLTAVTPGASSFLSVADDVQQPDLRTSTLNFTTGQTRGGLALVPVAPDGSVSIYNGASVPVHVILDVYGYFSDGTPEADGAVIASSPYRILDTRSRTAPVAARSVTRVGVVPNDGSAALFKAVVVSIAVATPRTSGYLTAWSGSGAKPAVSTDNFSGVHTVTTTVVVPVRSDGTFSIYNGSSGTVQLIVDVQGFVLNNVPATSAAKAARTVDAALAHSRAYGASRTR